MTLEGWRQLPKDGWHDRIKAWNKQKGFTKRIARAQGVRTALMSEGEARHEKKKWKKPLYQVPVLVWEEVPQHLPYRRGIQKNGEDPGIIYYDPTFLGMVAPVPGR